MGNASLVATTFYGFFAVVAYAWLVVLTRKTDKALTVIYAFIATASAVLTVLSAVIVWNNVAFDYTAGWFALATILVLLVFGIESLLSELYAIPKMKTAHN